MSQRKVRYTERFTGQPKLPIPASAAVPTTDDTPARPHWPWEEHEDIIKQIVEGFKSTHTILDRIEKAEKKNTHVIIQLDTGVQREILEAVKEILSIVKKIDSGLSKAEEDALAKTLHESSQVLEAAVEANQPMSSSSSPKSSKKKQTK